MCLRNPPEVSSFPFFDGMLFSGSPFLPDNFDDPRDGSFFCLLQENEWMKEGNEFLAYPWACRRVPHRLLQILKHTKTLEKNGKERVFQTFSADKGIGSHGLFSLELRLHWASPWALSSLPFHIRRWPMLVEKKDFESWNGENTSMQSPQQPQSSPWLALCAARPTQLSASS